MSNIKSMVRLRTNNEVDLDVKYFAKDDSLVDTYMDLSELLDYINELEENRDKAIEKINKTLCPNSDYVDYEYGTELLKQELLKILKGEE